MPARRSEYLTEAEFARITKGVEVEKGFGFIYSWRSNESGREYIGKWEGNLWALCVRYLREVRSGYVKNRAIINAMRCYGIDGFSLEVLFVSKERNELFEQEKHFIKLRKSKTVEGGYNCTGGGDGGDTFTWQSDDVKRERRKNISNASQRKGWSEEQREFMRNLYTGRPIPQEQRDKISQSLRGRVQSNETKSKRSESMKSIHLWNEIEFDEEQRAFIKNIRRRGKRYVAAAFNAKFGVSYSEGPFAKEIKKTKDANIQLDLFS